MNIKARIRDPFADLGLPAKQTWPQLINTDTFSYRRHLNCAVTLLDEAVLNGQGDRVCLHGEHGPWSYRELLFAASKIARMLVDEGKLIPGERVLLRGFNTPTLVACWFAVIKAGGIAVTTMAQLRQAELGVIIDKAQIRLALCERKLRDELDLVARPTPLEHIFDYDDASSNSILSHDSIPRFDNADTLEDDVCLIAFTSGTTGVPKATMHFHRDVLVVCDTFAADIIAAEPGDVFMGSAPLGFTFGLGGLVLFPMRIYASSVLLADTRPANLATAIKHYRPTILLTSPTAYKAILAVPETHFRSLRLCISSGEPLPVSTWHSWLDHTGLQLVNALGATEMLHAFVAARGGEIRPGSLGRAVRGYQLCILDDHNQPCESHVSGRLAVRGPTGCRYLSDQRQRDYVVAGWNVTGDLCHCDDDGYIWFDMRADDMIVSAGYNIAGPEVENALLSHPLVAECGVVGAPDDRRGQIVHAFVVLKSDVVVTSDMTKQLQDHVKRSIAPYKYPRAITFVDALPRTHNGKIQRHELSASLSV